MSARLILAVSVAAYGQQLTFDAAAIKPCPRTPPNVIDSVPPGGPGSSDPGRIHYTWMPLKRLIMNAYNVKDFQILGPDWLGSTRFDIEATMPPTTTMEQFRIMLQNLLVERFKLAIHHDVKELPIYSLSVAKGGIKMKESTNFDERPRTAEFVMTDRARLVGYQQTIDDLAGHLPRFVSRPVIDSSGRTAKYDFVLTFSLEGSETSDPDIFTALQFQLGLKLEAKKGPVDRIVIDHIEQTPSAN
jgi:uncharacterized protein (TIGR03435 family)